MKNRSEIMISLKVVEDGYRQEAARHRSLNQTTLAEAAENLAKETAQAIAYVENGGLLP